MRTMLCGSFSESKQKKLKIDDVDGLTFIKTLDVWCGKDDCQEIEMGEALELARVADRFQILEVVSAVEEALLRHLSVENCGDLLMWSGGSGMLRLEAEALTMAAKRFDEFAMTVGFTRMTVEALQNLLDENRLFARNEEAVLEAVVGWMKGPVGMAGGRSVLGKVRFPLMGADYLGNRVVGMLGEEDCEWISGVVAEALRAKAARLEGAVFEFELLGRKALEDRVGLGVSWEEYREGGELRLGGHDMAARAIAAIDGRICSGSSDGSIRVWSRASGAYELTMQAYAESGYSDFESDEEFDERGDDVTALVVWEDRLISGHDSGLLRVWNVSKGSCVEVLEGHIRMVGASGMDSVLALAVCGSRLVSSSTNKSVKVWAMEPIARPWGGPTFTCERSLLGHTDRVGALAGWQDKVASGSADGSIRVWDAGTGAHAATLAGHSKGVTALVVHGNRLLSASEDGTIRAWALGTWAGLRTVQAHGAGTSLFPSCLAVSGSKVLSGSWREDRLGNEVRVWGLEELDLQQTLVQPGFADVYALLALDKEVWGGVGKELVVWGRNKLKP